MAKNGVTKAKSTGPARVGFEDFVQMRIREAGVIVEMPDGREVKIPPVDIWPFVPTDAEDEDFMRLVLGDDADAWIEQGGTAKQMTSVLTNRAQLTLPESSASESS